MSSNNKRTYEIISLLYKNGPLSIKEIGEKFDVTEMTIRRDVLMLEKAGIVKRIAGAIMLVDDSPEFLNNYNLDINKNKAVEEKKEIAKLAATFIKKDDIVYIDIGSTASRIIDFIPNIEEITFVCSTYNTLSALMKKNVKQIFFSGGRLHPKLELFESKQGLNIINSTRTNIAFISAAGVNFKLGVTCKYAVEVDYKRAAILNAEKRVLIVDSRKFDTIAPAFFASLDEFDVVITDKGISEEWIKRIEKQNIELFIA